METIDYAKAYLKLGWSLIPIKPETKQPPIKWGRYNETKPSIEEVESWLKNGWYLAVVTGPISGVLVVDDDRVKNGLTEWGFTSPVVAQTQSGGKHFYYLYNREIHSHCNATLHVDLKAWHSYCLLPPFKGRKWLTSVSQNYSKLEPISDEIIRLINSDLKELNSVSSVREPLEMIDFIDIPEGARENKLYQYACSIFNKLPKDDASRILAGMNLTFKPPIDEERFNYTLSRAWSFVEEGKSEERKKPYIYKRDSSVDIEAKMETLEKTKFSDVFEPKLLSDIKKEDFKVEWLWDGYLAKGHITLLAALWKTGKSTLMAELFKCMQEEKTLAGQATHPSRVLYLSEERESQWVQRREEKGLTLPIYVLCNPLKRKLTSNEWESWVKKAADFCVANNLNLIVIDTMTTFSSVTDENDSSQVNAALLPLNYFREKNIAVLLIHHFRKSGGNEGTAARGSGALMSYVDIIIEFSRLEPDNPNGTQRKMISLSRFDETPAEIILDYIDGEYSSQVVTSSREAKKQNRAKQVLELIRKLIANQTIEEEFTSVDLYEQWDDNTFKRPTERTIRNYLDELITMEKITLSNEKRRVGKTEAKLYKINNGRRSINPMEISNVSSVDLEANIKEVFGV